MALPLAAIGLGVGLIGGIGKMFGRGKANRQMEALIAQNPTYKENPLARQRLGLAQQLMNARMPGAAQAERNIYSNQANQVSNIQRGATDSSQLLAMGANAFGQSNEAFIDLGQAEAQNRQQQYQNLAGAQQGVINEGDKAFEDQVRKFNDLASIRGAQNANRQNTWGDISNMGFGLANFGMSGGMGGLFGGGGGQGIADPFQISNMSGGTGARYNIPSPNMYTGRPNF
jgi:hypothetical protein